MRECTQTGKHTLTFKIAIPLKSVQIVSLLPLPSMIVKNRQLYKTGASVTDEKWVGGWVDGKEG
jgi:hypothetical protein